jgi:hypothetical protein
MEDLNNPESEIFTKTLEEQKQFILRRFVSIKRNRYLDDTMGCCGEKDIIAKHLNLGPAQNLVHGFFNYTTDKCILCNRCKEHDGIRQFERAHCNTYSRYDLLLMAVDDLYVDNTTPITVGDILKGFIQKHDICPIYMLCNLCHSKYDNPLVN